ncbi:MAG: hypothetical protein AAGI66_01000 [Cyanobacteria bacterium P01_H01_bin.74]
MLIVLPSTPTTEAASQWLVAEGIAHQVIKIPERLGYKTAADIAIAVNAEVYPDIPMRLTREGFVVMRVFKTFALNDDDEIVTSVG